MIKFPENKKFAFTIFDDTDDATVERIKPVYELLQKLGMATTKSVWVLPPDGYHKEGSPGHTLADREYMDFIKYLGRKGFEIAFHNASACSNKREDTIYALDCFKEAIGYYPRTHVNHERNKENIYWGPDRFDFPVIRGIYKIIKKFDGRLPDFEGHKPDSPYFWGDICQKHIKYVRNFVFREVNLLKVNPTLPYRDPKKPFVKFWFSSSEGASLADFNQLISPKNQQRLENEGGVCIVYTHFAYDFVKSGRVNPETEALLTELSKRDGWFVPVSTLLDYLLEKQPREVRPLYERLRMELKWFLSKLVYRTS